MHVMLRTYSGPEAKALAKIVEKQKAEAEGIAKSVPDIVSFTFASTDEGALSVTIGKSKGAVDDLHRKAMEWVGDKAAQAKVKAPTILEGPVIAHV